MNICSGPDNTHEIDMHEKPVFHNGPAAYFATYPYQAMHSRLKQEGIPVRYSFNAGQNQCNCILYSALHFAAQFLPGTVAGFLHVPMLPDEGVEGMTLEQSARAVRCCAEEIAKFLRPPMRTREEYRESL